MNAAVPLRHIRRLFMEKKTMKEKAVVKEQYLPTASEEFLESLRMVRHYLVRKHFKEVFDNRPREHGARPTLRDAFDVIDCYLERYRLVKEDSDIDIDE
jgi:hypothetical protein